MIIKNYVSLNYIAIIFFLVYVQRFRGDETIALEKTHRFLSIRFLLIKLSDIMGHLGMGKCSREEKWDWLVPLPRAELSDMPISCHFSRQKNVLYGKKLISC